MTIVERCRREIVEIARIESHLAVRHGWCEKEMPYGLKMSWLRLLQALKDAKRPAKRGRPKR